MNYSHLSAIALTAMMLLPTGVNAHCDGVRHAGDHPHCSGGGGSDNNVPFAVAVVADAEATMRSTLYAPASADSLCLAQAPSSKSLWATFPRHDLCAELSTDWTSITDDMVIKVETDRQSGAVMSVTVTGQDTIGDEGLFHQSSVITNIQDVVANPDGSFVIHVHADDVTLWKCDTHLLRKKTTCTEYVGTFAIHDMVYTPDP